MGDIPIAHRADGTPIFDNVATVVCVLVGIEGKLLAILRGKNPGAGLIGLPGGYHMKGETWQEAGAREVWEETGYLIDPKSLAQVGEVHTDMYGNNLIVAELKDGVLSRDKKWEQDFHEIVEVLLLDKAGDRECWAFPLHYKAAWTYAGG